MSERKQDRCGTFTRYKLGLCKCADCTEAHRVYASNRRRLVAYGRWDPWVDAEPVRQHVKRLQAAGLGRRQIGDLAGMDQSRIWRLEHGNPKKGTPPTKQLRPWTAARILAISPSLDVLGDAALVDATGSHRRIQALVAVGWPQARLARELGVSAANFGTMMRRPRVLASKARAIRDLYEELWDTVPECSSTQERLAVVRARKFAAARGWAPPMAWNDEDLDNPAAGPSLDDAICGIDEVAVKRALDGDKTVALTQEERVEAVRIGTADQLSAKDLADLLGASTRTIVRNRKKVAA